MAKKKRISSEQDTVAECFEESLAALEAIVGDLEDGSLSLADALARYEQAVKHLATCQKLLERAERKIELLSGVDANGNPITRPFDEAASETLQEKGERRSLRRSSDPKQTTGKVITADGNMDDRPRLF